ncbi:MAG: CRISPR-associated endonuclease Cas1 [Oscillospiraceae bacterium]|nr:CRISPR-associated endonuclease Cas1 [Oscillospiraceae bacterium]
MAFRKVVIESPARISVKNDQLLITADREYSLPVEDISALLLENRQSTITTAALSLLGQSGCALFVCGEKHIPCAVLTPFSQHSRALSTARMHGAGAGNLWLSARLRRTPSQRAQRL